MVGVRRGNEEAADTPGSVGALNNLSFAINIYLAFTPQISKNVFLFISANVLLLLT